MDTNEKIVKIAWQALRGELSAYSTSPGLCLAWVRTVIENAMGWPSHELYRRYVDGTWVQPEGYERSDGHWARDAERAFRDVHGMAIPPEKALPGDLLFNWKAAWSDRWGAYIGHVAIRMEHGMVAENIDPVYRPHSLKSGALALTPFEHWHTPSTVIRFAPD